jgi:hypothetical protein
MAMGRLRRQGVLGGLDKRRATTIRCSDYYKRLRVAAIQHDFHKGRYYSVGVHPSVSYLPYAI